MSKPYPIHAGGERVHDKRRDLPHELVGSPRVQHPREAAHLRLLRLLHLPVPVVHYPALPLAVRRVRRRTASGSAG